MGAAQSALPALPVSLVEYYDWPLVKTTCGHCGLRENPEKRSSTLFLCEEYETQAYCGTECHKQHWSIHKPDCEAMLATHLFYRKGAHQLVGNPRERMAKGNGVLIYQKRITGAPGQYSCTLTAVVLEEQDIVSYAFHDLAITKALGFLVRMASPVWGSRLPPQAQNRYREALLIDPDPTSATFGRRPCGRPSVGAAFLIREDGHPFHLKQAKALVEYCCFIRDATEYFVYKATSEEAEVGKHMWSNDWLNPIDFRGFFRKMKKRESKKDPRGWEGVECPV